MEIVTAFTECTDEASQNTNQQLQAVIKCCEDVQALGLHAIDYLTSREKSKMMLPKEAEFTVQSKWWVAEK